MKKISEEDVQRIIDMRKDGLTLKHIGGQFDPPLCLQFVRRVLSKQCVVKPKLVLPKVNKQRVQRILDLRQQGLSNKEVASSISLSEETVYVTLRNATKQGVIDDGWQQKPQMPDEERLQLILKLRKEGKTLREIAVTLTPEISAQRVAMILDNHIKKGNVVEVGKHSRKRWGTATDPDIIQKVLEAWPKGGGVLKHVASVVGVSRFIVGKIIKEHNLPLKKVVPHEKLHENELPKIHKRYKKGTSVVRIAEEYGVMPVTVYAAMRRYTRSIGKYVDCRLRCNKVK